MKNSNYYKRIAGIDPVIDSKQSLREIADNAYKQFISQGKKVYQASHGESADDIIKSRFMNSAQKKSRFIQREGL